MKTNEIKINAWYQAVTKNGDLVTGFAKEVKNGKCQFVFIGTNRPWIDADTITGEAVFAEGEKPHFSPLPVWIKEGHRVSPWGVISTVERFSVIFENGEKVGLAKVLFNGSPVFVEDVELPGTESTESNSTGTDDSTPKQQQTKQAPKVTAKTESAKINAVANELAGVLAKLGAGAASIDPAQLAAIQAEIDALADRVELVEKRAPKEYVFKIGEFSGKVTGTKHALFDKCYKLLAAGANIFLLGPAGTGKSFLAKQLADGLGLEFHETNSVLDQFSLSGFIDGTGKYQETEFYRAYRYGGVHHLDEADCSDAGAFKWLNNAVANNYCAFPCGMIRKHPNFRCIASGNTVGRGASEEYTAGQTLDASTLTRFMVVKIDYCENVEFEVSGKDAELVQFVHALRDAANKNGMNTALMGRILKNAATMKNAGITDAAEIVCSCYANYMTDDENRLLAGALCDNKSNRYMTAYKKMFAA